MPCDSRKCSSSPPPPFTPIRAESGGIQVVRIQPLGAVMVLVVGHERADEHAIGLDDLIGHVGDVDRALVSAHVEGSSSDAVAAEASSSLASPPRLGKDAPRSHPDEGCGASPGPAVEDAARVEGADQRQRSGSRVARDTREAKEGQVLLVGELHADGEDVLVWIARLVGPP